MNYYLMHKDDKVALLEIYEHTAYIENYKVLQKEIMPIFIEDIKTFNEWWRDRSIPRDRDGAEEILKCNNVLSSEVFLLKNLALNLSDCYWVKPINMDVSFKDVNFYENDFDNLTLEKLKTSTFRFNPSSSTTGQMTKFWHIEKGKRILTKTAEDKLFAIKQCINEEFGTFLHNSLNIFKTVEYTLNYDGHKIIGVSCPAFTTTTTEFVPMYQMLKKRDIVYARGTELRNAIIDSLLQNTLFSLTSINKFIDYMNITDFLISNTDRHLNNYGLLRDTNTLKYMGFAPMFDFGNSMMFVNSSTDVLKEAVFGKISYDKNMYKTDEKNARSFRDNVNIISLLSLPSPEVVYKFYADKLENKIGVRNIASLYKDKLEVLKRIQKGYPLHEIFSHRPYISIPNVENNDLPPLCL